MRLVAIRASNFRSYKSTMALESIPAVTVIIGPNNAGKSNVVELLAWYRGMVLGQGGRSSGEMKHTGNRNAPLTIEMEFELDVDEKRSLIAGTTSADETSHDILEGQQFLTRLRHLIRFGQGLEKEVVEVENLDGTWLPVFGWDPRSQNSVFWRLDLAMTIQRFAGAMSGTVNVAPAQRIEVQEVGRQQFAGQWPLQGTFEQRVADVLRGFVQRWQVIPPVRQITPRMDPVQEVFVQQGGGNLVRVLNTLQVEEPTKFGAMMNDVYQIVPDLERITAPLRGNETTALIQEPGNVRVEARDISTGLQQTMILVASLLTYPRNSFVLIEEPEIHLHAGSQRALLRLIKRLTLNENHLFMITSHSTIFAEISDDVSTYLVEKREGSSGIHLLNEGGELKHLKQVLGHENTDLFGFNAVLIVEGDTEETAIPILAHAQGLDLVRRGVRIVNIRGKGKTTRLRQLLQFLRDSDTVPYVMLDGSPDVKTLVEDWMREGLVKHGNVFLWDREFEDCFEDTLLVQAVQQLGAGESVQVKIDLKELAKARRTGKTVFSALECRTYETLGHGLSKPALGEKIAELVIAQGRARAKTAPEDALAKIADSLGT